VELPSAVQKVDQKDCEEGMISGLVDFYDSKISNHLVGFWPGLMNYSWIEACL
jgi:hypothetical protein